MFPKDLKKYKKGTFATIYHSPTHQGLLFKVSHKNNLPILKTQFDILKSIDHPSFPRVYKWMEQGERCGYSMEWIKGEELHTWIKKHESDASSIKEILMNILDALSHLHGMGFVHGDIKPSHIFVTEEGIKIIDPGFNSEILTPVYSAPESFFGDFTPASDIYSTGMVFYTLLGGENPFEGNLQDILSKKLNFTPPPLNTINPDVPDEISSLIMEMIEPAVEKRPRCADDIFFRLKVKGEERVKFFYPVFTGREEQLEKFTELIESGKVFICQVYGERGSGRKRLLSEFKKIVASRGIPVKTINDTNFKQHVSGKSGWAFFIENIDISKSFIRNLAILKDFYNNIFVLRLDRPEKMDTGLPIIKIHLQPFTRHGIKEFLLKTFPNMVQLDTLTEFLLSRTGGNPGTIYNLLTEMLNSGVILRKGKEFIVDEEKLKGIKGKRKKFSKKDEKILKTLSIFEFPVEEEILDEIGIEHPYARLNELLNKGIISREKGKLWITDEDLKRELRKNLNPEELKGIDRTVVDSGRIKSPINLYASYLRLGKKIGVSYLKKALLERINHGDPDRALRLVDELSPYIKSGVEGLIRAKIHALKIDHLGVIKELKGLPEWLRNLEFVKYNLLITRAMHGDYDGFEEEIKEYLREDFRFYHNALAHLGKFYIIAGRMDEAEKLLKRFTIKDSEYYRLKCFLDFSKMDWRKLERSSEEALRIATGLQIGINIIFKGIAAMNMGKIEDAKRLFKQGMEETRKRGDVHNLAVALTNYGALLATYQSIDAGIDYLEEALKIFRHYKKKLQDEQTTRNLVIHHYKLGYVEKALEYLKDFENTYGEITRNLRVQKFYAYVAMNNLVEAEKTLKEFGGEDTFPILGRAYLQLYRGKLKEAYALFLDYFKKENEEYMGVYFTAGIIGLLTDSRVDFLRELFRRPDWEFSVYRPGIEGILERKPEGLINLGNFFERVKEFQDAGLSYMGAGKILMDSGDFNGAIDILKKAERVFEGINNLLMKSIASGMISSCAMRISNLSTSSDVLREIEKLVALIDKHGRTDIMLEELIRFLGAERGAIIQVKNGKPILISAMGIDEATISDAGGLSKTIAKKGSRGEILVVSDALGDNKYRHLKSISRNKIRSILCVPIYTGNSIFGVLYLDSRLKKGLFTEKDRDFLLAVGRILGTLIEKGKLLDRIMRERERMERIIQMKTNFHGIVGVSEEIRNIIRLIERVAPTDENILITGETGTGKELVAEVIHQLSTRKNGPFVTVECSSIQKDLLESELFGHRKGAFTGAIREKKGLCEAANGGTLFLDEIGDLPFEVQAKLLRLTEKGTIRRVGEEFWRNVDVRIISATNRDLGAAVNMKMFRQDLYFRLKGIEINIPPLRKRPEDIPILLDFYLEKAIKKSKKKIKGFSSQVMGVLIHYSWPGNVRELIKTINRAVALTDGEYIELDAIPDEIKEEIFPDEFTLKETEAILKKKTITKALTLNNWNITRTAQTLNISRRHLYRLLKKYNIKKT